MPNGEPSVRPRALRLHLFAPIVRPGQPDRKRSIFARVGGRTGASKCVLSCHGRQLKNDARDFERDADEVRATRTGRQGELARACSFPRISPPSVRPYCAPGLAGPETADIRSCGGGVRAPANVYFHVTAVN